MERCSVVIPEGRLFPQDTGISRLGSDGARPEPWNKDREHGGRHHTLTRDTRIEHYASINQCHQVWLDSSRSFFQKLECTHKYTWPVT